MRRTLFEEKNSSIWIKIELIKTEDEKIVIHEQDSGKIVKKIKQRYDYEYFLTIEKEDVQNLIKKVNLESVRELFDWIAKNYSHDKVVSQLREKLVQLEIKYQFTTW